MQAKLDQQSAEIADLQAHQSQAGQPNVIPARQDQLGDRSGAGQTSAALKTHLHRQQERSGVDAGPETTSIIRYAAQRSHTNDKQSVQAEFVVSIP